MSYRVEITSNFKKQAKKLLKKFPSLKAELGTLVESLSAQPEQGTALRNHCFKIRIAIASKGKGKSGGARVITHIQVLNEKVFLLSIYDKSEQSTLSDKDLDQLLGSIP